MQFASEGIEVSAAQARILAALSWGGMLTEDQIRTTVGIAARKVRRALAQLTARDLVYTRSKVGRWEITSKGFQLVIVQPGSELATESDRHRLKTHGDLIGFRRQR